ncbi:Superoxide dismutase [Coniochaeta hoffmannii]|uniref:superoxide dismutase n=1 Tax=Coniochaeta hoffmannii TaxID=91930 RepID=A0AA38SLE8_9PEZI|nr:Superoxide dismutase [Coniochaeta hoffmannii]
MRTSSILSLLTAAAASLVAAQSIKTGDLGNATVVVNNAVGTYYAATLPDTAFDKAAFPNGGNVQGSITATSSPDGIGVWFKVQFSNLPKEGGPFTYHIHVDPVPSDGNCTKTLAHLDPFLRGEDPPCDPKFPQTCQVGDLSGKHGKITSDPFVVTYYDQFASTAEGIGAFFGNRSFVVHYPNKTRISCANFAKIDGASPVIPTSSDCSAAPPVTSTGVPQPSGNTTVPHPTGNVPQSTKPPVASNTPVTVSAGNNVQSVSHAFGLVSFAAAIMFML